jgi:hypothetical protein
MKASDAHSPLKELRGKLAETRLQKSDEDLKVRRRPQALPFTFVADAFRHHP